MKKNLGFIGWGFVNKAISFAFQNDNEIFYNSLEESNATKKEIAEKCEFIFIAVPTPANNETGECYTNIIENILKELNEYKPKGIVIIKSTVPIGFTRKQQELNKNLRLVFSPEYLTERSSKLDYINSARHTISGKKEDLEELEKFLRSRFIHTPIFKSNYEEAEMVKLMNNNFFALKVIFMNTFYEVANKLNLDWDIIVKNFLADYRVTNSHIQVPGHDGKRGYSGSCFPKDSRAWIFWLKQNGFKEEAELFETSWKLNLKYRPEKDWEQLKGRAVKND